MRVHCLFEQSGTFKNEFKKLGHEAYDYDILDDFGQTDYKLDLFNEIRRGYENKPSIFDNITKDDLIIAFFPCTRFCHQIRLAFQGNNAGFKDWNEIKKLEYSRGLFKELAEYYDLVSKLALICLNRGLKLIIENPRSTTHILTDYWPLKASIIDEDRTRRGDYYIKPTQFWFINLKPKHNFIFEKRVYHKKMENISHQSKVDRSMIHPSYANRFIREFIL